MFFKFLVNTYYKGRFLNCFVYRSNSIDDTLVFANIACRDLAKSKCLVKEKLDIYIYDIIHNLVFYYIYVDDHLYYISLK